MIRVNSLFSAGIYGKYLITISGCCYKERLVILTMIMWFACPHQFTEIYFIVRVGLIKNENDFSWISRNSQTLCSQQHSYSSFVQSWKGLEVKSYWICLRSLKSTGFLYWVFKSPWNSIPCLLHTVFCEIRLSRRRKFGSSLV